MYYIYLFIYLEIIVNKQMNYRVVIVMFFYQISNHLEPQNYIFAVNNNTSIDSLDMHRNHFHSGKLYLVKHNNFVNCNF